MICLGHDTATKLVRIEQYRRDHGITRTFVLSPERFRVDVSEAEHLEYSDIIKYRFFYRLLQEIDGSTLVVINECLRTQSRHDLTYNCIRNFLNQTTHQIVFQHLPIIDTIDDFMTLFDFDTRSRWKREKWRPEFTKECQIHACPVRVDFDPEHIETNAKTRTAYAKKKRALIDGLGLRDPHTIPRNLLLMAGKAKLPHAHPDRRYLGRNNRFKLDNLTTYRDVSSPDERDVFEFPHNFIDFSDAMTITGQSRFRVLVSDLKVDQWYLQRYREWAGRLADAYAALHG